MCRAAAAPVACSGLALAGGQMGWGGGLGVPDSGRWSEKAQEAGPPAPRGPAGHSSFGSQFYPLSSGCGSDDKVTVVLFYRQ